MKAEYVAVHRNRAAHNSAPRNEGAYSNIKHKSVLYGYTSSMHIFIMIIWLDQLLYFYSKR